MHYHITTTSPRINMPVVVTEDKEKAERAYCQMVSAVSDLTGLLEKHTDKEKTTFIDGTTVRLFSCEHDCIN